MANYAVLMGPKFQGRKADGSAAAGYKLFTYEVGTSTKKTTYSTKSGTANDNPIILSDAGEANVYLNGNTDLTFTTDTDSDPPTAAIWGPITAYGFSDFALTILDDTTASAVLTTLGVAAFAQTLLDDTTASAFMTTLGFSTLGKSLIDDTTMGAFLTSLGISAPVQTILDDASIAAVRTTLELTVPLGFSSPQSCRPYATGNDVVAFVPGRVVLEKADGSRHDLAMPTSITKTVTGKTASVPTYFYAGVPGSGTTLAAGDITASEAKPTNQAQRGFMDAAGNLKYIGAAAVDSGSNFIKSYIGADGMVLLDPGQDIGSITRNGFADVSIAAYVPSVDGTIVKFVVLTGVNSALITRKNGSAAAGTSWVTVASIGIDVLNYEAIIDASAIFEMNTANVANTKNLIIGWLELR